MSTTLPATKTASFQLCPYEGVRDPWLCAGVLPFSPLHTPARDPPRVVVGGAWGGGWGCRGIRIIINTY